MCYNCIYLKNKIKSVKKIYNIKSIAYHDIEGVLPLHIRGERLTGVTSSSVTL